MKRILFLFFLLSPAVSVAGLYLEIGYEDGGDTLITAETRVDYEFSDYDYEYDKDIDVGGGGKIAIGIHQVLGEEENRSITLSLGYLFDDIDATNGDAEYDTITVDAIYGFHFGAHRLGVGASYHKDPEFEVDLDGFPSQSVEFDDALGLVVQYSYVIQSRFHIGLRLTEMDYDVNGTTLDAASVGMFFAYAYTSP